MPQEEDDLSSEPPEREPKPGARAGVPDEGGSSTGRRRLIIGLVALLAAGALIFLVTRTTTTDKQAANGPGKAVRISAGATGVEKATGRAWRAVKGDWVIQGDRISIRSPGKLLSSLLVTDATTSNAMLSVRMPVVASGAGIVFRYHDPFNYWSLSAVPNVASWQVWKVVGAKTTTVRNTGLSPIRAGTLVTVATRVDGVISISFNGKIQTTFLDTDLADRRGAGVAAIGGGATAVFSGFTITPAIAAPPTTG